MLFVQLTLDGYKMSRRDESKIRCHTSVSPPHHLISNTSSSRPHHSRSLSVPTSCATHNIQQPTASVKLSSQTVENRQIKRLTAAMTLLEKTEMNGRDVMTDSCVSRDLSDNETLGDESEHNTRSSSTLHSPSTSYSLASGHRRHAHTPEEGNELRTRSSTASPHTVAVPHCHVDINDLSQGGRNSLSQLSSLSGENLSEREGYEMRKSGAI